MIFARPEQNQTKVFVTISCNLCWMKRVQPRLHSAGSHVPEPRDDLHQCGGGSLGWTPAPRPVPPISGGEFLHKEGRRLADRRPLLRDPFPLPTPRLWGLHLIPGHQCSDKPPRATAVTIQSWKLKIPWNLLHLIRCKDSLVLMLFPQEISCGNGLKLIHVCLLPDDEHVTCFSDWLAGFLWLRGKRRYWSHLARWEPRRKSRSPTSRSTPGWPWSWSPASTC